MPLTKKKLIFILKFKLNYFNSIIFSFFQFDPAMQRFQAMRASYSEYFKPTAKTFRAGMLMVVIPIVFAATIFKRERGGREKLYRSGEISYRDRPFKFI